MREVTLCVVAAYLVTMVYYHVLPSADWVIWHKVSIDGQGLAPLQYRWLSFMIPELISRVGINITDAYMIERFIFTSVALFFFGKAACIANGQNGFYFFSFYVLSLAVYYAAATLPVIQPSEEINLAFFSVGLFMLVSKVNIFWWPLFIAAGAINKDTVGFFIPYILVYEVMSGREGLKLYISLALSSMAFASVYISLRWLYGTEREYAGGFIQIDHNIRYLVNHPFDSVGFILPSLFALVLSLLLWKKTPRYMKAYIPTIILFTIGHFTISRIDEFRTYSALAVVTIPYMLYMMMAGQDVTNKRSMKAA